jgi:chromatin segregation and condensation protein Rec8/ScpA/Scc1 (kleisin family)
VSVAECARRILTRFALDDAVDFTDLFDRDRDRADVIVTFLALLELIRLRAIRAGQTERFGRITVTLAAASLAEAVELSRHVTEADSWGRSGEDDERQRPRDPGTE